MNHYEAVYSLDPKLDDEQLTGVKTELKGKLAEVGAQNVVELKAERRNLTFPIKKQNDAFFLIYGFQGPGDAVAKLRVELKHHEKILRMSYLRVPPTAVVPPAPVITAEVAPAPEAAVPPTPEAPAPTDAAPA